MDPFCNDERQSCQYVFTAQQDEDDKSEMMMINSCSIQYYQDDHGQLTNNGIKYKLQLLFANGQFPSF